MKETKEFKAILDAIHKWAEKNDSKVQIVASFISFKEKDGELEPIDDRILAFGVKDCLREVLKDLDTQIFEEKEEFISW